ncbi:MAG: trypsin-like peptidase domain-containing protein [Phycisphaerae bacterium]
MRDWKTFLPLAVALVIVAISAGLAPMLAREISYSITLGRSQAARSELAKLSREYGHLSQMFRLTVDAVAPAVVEIHVYGGSGSVRAGRQVQYGLGSGVIIDADFGYVLTNHHVIADADRLEVVLQDGRRLTAEWSRSDEATDLAVLKIAPARLVAAPLGDSAEVEVGDLVLAIGAPDGLSQSVTSGIISAIGRTAVGSTDSYRDFMQTDAAINKGNSGGPLVNLRGEVIGINTAIHSRSGGYEGIGFAIPANMAWPIARQLIETGQVARGYLGIGMQPVDDDLAESFSLPHTRGVLVAQVAPGGPAEQAGLQEGDFVTEIDGRDVRGSDDVRTIIASLSPGHVARIVVYRQGEQQSIEVRLGRQPEDMSRAMIPRRPRQEGGSGLSLETLDGPLARRWGYPADQAGLLVVDVRAGSAAWRAGLRSGEVITHADGTVLESPEAFVQALDRADPRRGVRLKVRNPVGQQRFVLLRP